MVNIIYCTSNERGSRHWGSNSKPYTISLWKSLQGRIMWVIISWPWCPNIHSTLNDSSMMYAVEQLIQKFAAEHWGEAEGIARRGRGCSVALQNIGHNNHKKLSGFMYMIRKPQSNTEVWVLRIRDFEMNLEISNCFPVMCFFILFNRVGYWFDRV